MNLDIGNITSKRYYKDETRMLNPSNYFPGMVPCLMRRCLYMYLIITLLCAPLIESKNKNKQKSATSTLEPYTTTYEYHTSTIGSTTESVKKNQKGKNKPTVETLPPTTEEIVAPTTQEAVAPTTEEVNAPTTQEVVVQTTQEKIVPTTQQTVEPTTQEKVVPTTEKVAPTTQAVVTAKTNTTLKVTSAPVETAEEGEVLPSTTESYWEQFTTTFGPESNVTPQYNATNATSSQNTNNVAMTAGLAVASTFGIVLGIAVIILVARRAYDGWQKRHYTRMDFLING